MSYWDAIAVGIVEALGSHAFSADEIRRFAAKYDPQPFHLDEEAAKRSVLGGLCASGWHTAAVFMRLNVAHRDAELRRWTAAGHPAPRLGPSPGARSIRWLRPVHAGDVLTYRQTVTAKRALKGRPGWGVVESQVEAVNQTDDLVFAMKGAVFIGTD